jgi:hypothetical protein
MRRPHPRAPQRLRDGRHAENRDAGQVHLHQSLLNGSFPPPVALDDRRLQRLAPQLRHSQRHIAGLGLHAPLGVAGPRITTSFSPLVALRIAKPISLGIRQGVQRLLDRPANYPVQMPPDLLVVDRDDIRQRNRLILVSHGGFVPLFRLT